MNDVKTVALKRPHKIFKRSSLDDFVAAAQLLGVTEPDLASELGYSKSAPSGWREAGAVPAVVAWALKGIIAERCPAAEAPTAPPKVLVLRLAADGASPEVLYVGDAPSDAVTVAGRTYWLVPAPRP